MMFPAPLRMTPEQFDEEALSKMTADPARRPNVLCNAMRHSVPWPRRQSRLRAVLIGGVLCAGCTLMQPTDGNIARWELLPTPDRASVHALARGESGLLLAGTGSGLFVSEDHGSSWRLRSPRDWRITAVLVTRDGSILVGVYRGGIQRSNDGGESWAAVGFQRNVYVDGVVEDDAGRLFAAVAHSVEQEATGVFRSDDDGATWSQAGLTGVHVHAISAPTPGQLYAGAEEGAFRSDDGGEAWESVGELASATPLSHVLEFDGVLFAAFGEPRHRSPGSGVLRSADGGVTWGPMPGLPPSTSVHALVAVGRELFAACGDVLGRGGAGVYRSLDLKTWERAGLEGEVVKSLIATPEGQLFAGAEETGVFAFEGDDPRWDRRYSGLVDWSPAAIAVDAQGQLHALAGRFEYAYNEGSTSWSASLLPMGTAPPTPFNFISLPEGTLVVPGWGGVFLKESSDGTWTRRKIPGVEGPAFDVHATGDGRLLVTFLEEGAFVTRDLGKTWTSIAVPADTRGVVVGPSGTFLAFGKGVHRATPEGDWARVVSGQQVAFTLATCGETIYCGSAPDGVSRSLDDGRTWQRISEEPRRSAMQSGYLAVHSILCLPQGGLLAATFGNGVLHRGEEGLWRNASSGLPSQNCGDLASDASGRVYVVTARGVCRIQLP